MKIDRPSKVRLIAYLTAAVLGFLVILVVSPLTLALIGIMPLDWDKLNSVGQSYTGIAALFSAAALVGLAYSVRLQSYQVTIAQHQVLREMQFGLNQMAVNDESLAFKYGVPPYGEDFNQWRAGLLGLMWMRYLQFGLSLGAFPEEYLRAALREVFASEPVRKVWSASGGRFIYPDKSQAARQFLVIANEEFERVIKSHSEAAKDNKEINSDKV